MPGAFKLDHLRPVKPLLFPKISNFFTFILGVNSYFPREGKAENGKMDFSQPECGTGFLVPGPFKLDHLHPLKLILLQKCSAFLTFIRGLPFLINPVKGRMEAAGGWIWEKGIHSKVSVLGAFNLDLLQPVKLISTQNVFQLFLAFLPAFRPPIINHFFIMGTGERGRKEGGKPWRPNPPTSSIHFPLVCMPYKRHSLSSFINFLSLSESLRKTSLIFRNLTEKLMQCFVLETAQVDLLLQRASS